MNVTDVLKTKNYNLRPGLVKSSGGEYVAPITFTSNVAYDENNDLTTILDSLKSAIQYVDFKNSYFTKTLEIPLSYFTDMGTYLMYTYSDTDLVEGNVAEFIANAVTYNTLCSYDMRWMICDTLTQNGQINIYMQMPPDALKSTLYQNNVIFTGDLCVNKNYELVELELQKSDWKEFWDDGVNYTLEYTNAEIKSNTMCMIGLDLENNAKFYNSDTPGGYMDIVTSDGKADIYCDIRFEGKIQVIIYQTFAK